MEKMGPLSQRATMGNRSRRLQRERQRLGLLLARPSPIALVSLGRRWARRHLRYQTETLFFRRALERQRPDSERTPLRADQQRRESRRGCQRVLLLPRQHADPFVHEVLVQVPASGVSV